MVFPLGVTSLCRGIINAHIFFWLQATTLRPVALERGVILDPEKKFQLPNLIFFLAVLTFTIYRHLFVTPSVFGKGNNA
jgi:hypothetical protein